MARIHITTTVKPALHERAVKAGMKWSYALERGIMELLREPVLLDDGAIVESPDVTARIAKLLKANQTLQDELLRVREQLEK